MATTKRSGKRLKRTKTDPTRRAAKRLEQAQRAVARLNDRWLSHGYPVNLDALAKQQARIAAIESGNWPVVKPSEEAA